MLETASNIVVPSIGKCHKRCHFTSKARDLRARLSRAAQGLLGIDFDKRTSLKLV